MIPRQSLGECPFPTSSQLHPASFLLGQLRMWSHRLLQHLEQRKDQPTKEHVSFNRLGCPRRRQTIFAAGCSACILFRIVAPSFVTITSPFDVWIYIKKMGIG